MRHIPEAELHAYLDQALPRDACVEIESHLAVCPVCQTVRDDIAALRDRTTALLASLAPRTVFMTPFETIRHRTAAALLARRRRRQAAAWAASVAVAIGFGWAARSTFGPRRVADKTAVTPSAVAAAQPRPLVPDRPRAAAPTRNSDGDVASGNAPAPTPADSVRDTSRILDRPPVSVAATTPSATDSAARRGDLVMDGAWKTMSWNGARAEAGGQMPPHIDGLPVVEVQVQAQANEPGKRPTMVVAQQLASGEVIRTIEGPTGDVSRLLGRRVMTDPEPTLSPLVDQAHANPNRTMTVRQGDRMLAITGAVPHDSLRAMMRRVRAEMPEK